MTDKDIKAAAELLSEIVNLEALAKRLNKATLAIAERHGSVRSLYPPSWYPVAELEHIDVKPLVQAEIARKKARLKFWVGSHPSG